MPSSAKKLRLFMIYGKIARQPLWISALLELFSPLSMLPASRSAIRRSMIDWNFPYQVMDRLFTSERGSSGEDHDFWLWNSSKRALSLSRLSKLRLRGSLTFSCWVKSPELERLKVRAVDLAIFPHAFCSVSILAFL
jgi:hypothetical protein